MRRFFSKIMLVVLIILVLNIGVFAVESDPLAGSDTQSSTPVTNQPVSSAINPYFTGTLKTSRECIEMLKDMEGYLSKPAGDYAQYSIGYGCNIKYLKQHHESLEISAEDLQKVLSSTDANYILKEDKAEALMMYVLVEVEEKLDKFLEKHNILLNQYQYDSLVSFTYNLGYGWLADDSRLGEVLIAGNYTINELASAMGVYCHVTVNNEAKVLDLLVERRIREIKLFLFGAYDLDDVEHKFCTLRYNAGDGDPFTDIGFYQVGQPYQILFEAEPTEKTLPYFVGWYDETGRKITASTLVEKSITVTAVFSDMPADPELFQQGSVYQPGNAPTLGETEYEKEEDTWTPVDITAVFSDMKVDDWHYSYVCELYSKAIIDGYPDRTFRPNNTVTTGEALKMILLAAGYETPEPVASHWARNFLNLALERGIIDRGDITDLDIPINRAMMAKVVARALSLIPMSDQQYFTDTNDGNVQLLFEYGISDGYGDGTFRPDRSLTRAELSAIVCRMYKK